MEFINKKEVINSMYTVIHPWKKYTHTYTHIIV